jgi:hypothetical protein
MFNLLVYLESSEVFQRRLPKPALHLALGVSATPSITNRTIRLDKCKQKLQRLPGAPYTDPTGLCNTT